MQTLVVKDDARDIRRGGGLDANELVVKSSIIHQLSVGGFLGIQRAQSTTKRMRRASQLVIWIQQVPPIEID
jgi:hypothetical protein